jgi:hypothetical protein
MDKFLANFSFQNSQDFIDMDVELGVVYSIELVIGGNELMNLVWR